MPSPALQAPARARAILAGTSLAAVVVPARTPSSQVSADAGYSVENLLAFVKNHGVDVGYHVRAVGIMDAAMSEVGRGDLDHRADGERIIRGAEAIGRVLARWNRLMVRARGACCTSPRRQGACAAGGGPAPPPPPANASAPPSPVRTARSQQAYVANQRGVGPSFEGAEVLPGWDAGRAEFQVGGILRTFLSTNALGRLSHDGVSADVLMEFLAHHSFHNFRHPAARAVMDAAMAVAPVRAEGARHGRVEVDVPGKPGEREWRVVGVEAVKGLLRAFNHELWRIDHGLPSLFGLDYSGEHLSDVRRVAGGAHGAALR